MEDLQLVTNPAVEEKFANYPTHIKPKIERLRQLILETAKEDADLVKLEETLKWGEPSYLAKKGSTIRIDWKAKTPEQYAIYFKCTSKLVSTFKEVYGDTFNYENTRAILFSLDDKIPEKQLKECIHMALNYHKLKHLDKLGK